MSNIAPSTREKISDEKTRKKCRETILAESIEIIYKIVTFLLIKWPKKSSVSPEATSPNQTAFKVFSYFVHIVLALNSGRFWFIFIDDEVRKEHMIVLALVIAFYGTFITCSILCRLFCTDVFVQMRDRLLELEFHLENEKKLIHLTQQLKIMLSFQLAIGTLISILIWSLVIYSPREKSVLPIFFSYPITVESDAYLTVSFIFMILLTVGSMWTQVIANIAMWLMRFLQTEFNCLAESFRRDFPRFDTSQQNNLSVAERSSRIFDIYEAHDNLCRVLESTNFLCRAYLGFVLSVSIAQICLLTYELINRSMGTFDFVYLITIVIVTVAGAFFYLKESIKLKSSAHQLTDDLYAIDLRNLSSEASLKVSIFLTRLTSSPIGISVAGLFVIDHSTILMLTGTLLTYIIVVLQTKAPECDCQNNNNITTPGI